MRLFVGIAVPDPPTTLLLNACRRNLPPAASVALRWSPPENLHLTLSFLGQVDPERLDAVVAALKNIRGQPLRITLDGLDVFANAGVLIARVKPSGPLLALAEDVVAAMESCGFPREQRPWQPHLTLARQKERRSLRLAAASDPVFSATFSAREFLLYQSQTRPGGAHYEVLARFPLGAA